MGGKDDQEGNNDSGSDDDIAFADDDNDTKDEETNVESYDSDDENLEEVSFMLSIFLYRHLVGWEIFGLKWWERSAFRARARLRERERPFKRVKEKEKCNNEFSSRRAFLSLSFLTLRWWAIYRRFHFFSADRSFYRPLCRVVERCRTTTTTKKTFRARKNISQKVANDVLRSLN